MINIRQTIFVSIILSMVLTIYGGFVIWSGNTFVPIELDAVRGHATFIEQKEFSSYNKYYDKHRDADNFFQHVRINAEAIQSQDDRYGFVTTILNGYPIFFGLENLKGISFNVGLLLHTYFKIDPLLSAVIGSDISLIFWSIVCIIVSILICHSLKFSLLQSIPTIFILSPLSNLYTYESLLMSYSAVMMLALAFLWRNDLWKCVSLVFLSTFLTILSNDFHAFLYFPIFGLSIAFFILFKEGNYRLFFLSAFAVLLAIVIKGDHIYQIINFLKTTLQDPSNSAHLSTRIYHPFIVTALFDWPILDYIKSLSKGIMPDDLSNFLFPSVTLKFSLIPGIIMLYLFLFDHKHIEHKIFIWISILLLAGPLHYLIGMFVPQYAAETSIRLHTSLNIFLSLYVINIISKNKDWFFKNQKIIFFVGGILSIYLIQFVLITFRDQGISSMSFWIPGIFYILSLFFFVLALRNKSTYILAFSLVILPLTNMFGPTGMQTLRPNSTDVMQRNSKVISNEIKTTDNVLLAGSAKTNTIHPNFLLGHGLNVIDAYLTPYPKNITNLLLDIKSHNYELIKKGEDTSKEFKYNDTRSAFLVKNINRLSYTNKRFIELFGVNIIIVPSAINLNWPEVTLKKEIGNLKIYEYKNPEKFPKYTCNLKYAENIDFGKLMLLGSNVVVTKDKNVIEHNTIKEDCNNNRVSSDLFMVDKNYKIAKGVVRTNIRYDPQLMVKSSSGKDIISFQCDVAFTCLLIEEDIPGPLGFNYENKRWR